VDAALRALSDPRRRGILDLIREVELPAGEIARRFEVTRPAISQHLSVLRDAGLVSERRQGTRRFYRARSAGAAELRGWLDELAEAEESTVDEATQVADGVIERELRIDAAPATVFAYWTDPAKMARWMGRQITLDPRPGGEFRVDYNGSDIARGTFLEVDPPVRLVLTWGWEAAGDPTPPGASVVEITLVADGDGDGTILRLRHSGLPAEAVQGHADGWDQFVPGLAQAATAG
jgi:uncharacterized protein YndB with AHSA1/START domain